MLICGDKVRTPTFIRASALYSHPKQNLQKYK